MTGEGAQTVPDRVARDDVDTVLREWMTDYAPTGPDDPLWRLAKTPPLALEWPPTGDTRWVQWVYASGLSPGLVDAEVVSYPWASVELIPGIDEADIRLVTPQITAQPTPQGVAPLEADALETLGELPAASSAALALTGEPDSETSALIRGAYGAWLATNGVIVASLPDAHGAFIRFVRSGG